MTSTLAELGPQLGEPASGPAQPGTVRDLLQQASVALDAGRQLKARLLLEEVLQADPRSEQGWLWLADAVESAEERRFCLEQVLSLNRRNALARRALERMAPGPIVSPLLPVARAALDVGRTAEACCLLGDVLRVTPESEMGWLWLADAVESDEERRFCLERVLFLNRDNRLARQGLDVLGTGPARSPLAAPTDAPGTLRETPFVPPVSSSSLAPLSAGVAVAALDRPALPGGLVFPTAVPVAVPIAAGYLGALTLAEVLTALFEPRIGLVLHGIMLLGLLLHTALTWGHPLHRLLICLAFAPLIRLLSLSMPLADFPQVYWYFIISVPLFVAAVTGLRLLGFSIIEVGLNLKALPVQIAVGLVGLSLGYIEYRILQPSPLAAGLSWQALWLPGLILLVSTGFVEELIFRGMMQQAVTQALGRAWGIVYVAALFAVLHVGHLSLVDVAFVFVVAIYFGLVKDQTGSILGVTLSHGLTNIVLFLTLPLGVNHFDLIGSRLFGG
jgi:membrane protease YdiL (CAAX protease family)